MRTWFGLHLDELALFLGVSRALVHKLETGQVGFSPAVVAALLPLSRHLPAPEVQAEAEAQAAAEASLPSLPASLPLPKLPPGAPAPDAADLDLRCRAAQAQAARLLTQAATIAHRARVAHRWAAVLPDLLPPDPDEPVHAAHYAALAAAAPGEAPTRPADRARWLRGWLARRARPLSPAEVTRYYRLRAQAVGLLAEAAALDAA